MIICLFIFGFSYVGIYTYAWLNPKLQINKTNHFYLYDNNNILYTNSNAKDWVNLKDISPHLINATISIEDKRFFKHHGFDFPRIAKALYINSQISRKVRRCINNYSTICQNLF